MNKSKWDQRIRRADDLSTNYPFAADILRFYSQVTSLQKDLYASMAGADVRSLSPKFPTFLDRIAAVAPVPLAQCARELQRPAPEALESFWRTAPQFQPEPGRAAELLMCLFLQPYAEYTADRSQPPPPRETFGTCPFCAARPIAGILRPEGDGGKRSLLCALCATEWNIGRIVCPACGEETVEKLAVYTADQFPHVRVEACDTCRYYIKTVDLTKNGRAIPVVDELAAIPLDLWAQRHDYKKLRPNLLGL
jgi:FdhE protein